MREVCVRGDTRVSYGAVMSVMSATESELSGPMCTNNVEMICRSIAKTTVRESVSSHTRCGVLHDSTVYFEQRSTRLDTVRPI